MLDEQTGDPSQLVAELRRQRDEALEQQRAIAEALRSPRRACGPRRNGTPLSFRPWRKASTTGTSPTTGCGCRIA